jgi:autotransporter-associated beta strand protein
MRTIGTTGIFFFAVSLSASQLAQGDSSTWNLNPTSGDWNTAANWTPASVPNAPDATAIFDVSNITNVSLSGRTTVGEIIFNPGASAFTITAPDQMADALSIVGAGLSNESGIEQALVAPEFGTFLGLPTVIFKGTALAGNLITLTAIPLGGIRFQENSGADHATIVAAERSAVVFADKSNAGSAIITSNGTDRASSYGSEVDFIGHSDAANAILTAESGSGGGGGGRVYFTDDSSGGLAQVQVFGTGTLLTDHNEPGVTIGSLEGDGIVSIGLGTLSIGSNGRDTVFSGVIQDFTFPSPLRKVGDGILHLQGASTYTAGTTIDGGQLLAENTAGFALGTGPVQVNSGTLGGKGIIAGAVTVGTNTKTPAFLAPSKGVKKPATLTILGAITLNDDSTYIYKLDTQKVKADEVIANGVVIDSGAKFSLRPSGNNALTVGQVFTVLSNTSTSPITGTFHNLADGAIVNVNGNNLQASYSGGDGNDLTLTVVP